MVPKRKTRRAEVTKKLRSAVDDTLSTLPPANVVNTSSREEGCEAAGREARVVGLSLVTPGFREGRKRFN